ncbi:MAG: DUF2442 domain-containing protein [Lachnospiraceae bacterium]|nr:DUF2442 domain-containing protein [Lachnospiraceae bacterium]
MEYIQGAEALLPRVSSVEVRRDYFLMLSFRNGEKRLFDASELMKLPVYKQAAEHFSLARVEYGTVVWPGDVDISPETLYLKSIPVR